MMAVDLTGVAAIIIAIGTPMTVLFTQFNARKVDREDRAEAKLERAANALAAKNQIDAQNVLLAEVKKNTDGILSATKDERDSAKDERDRALTEVARVADGGDPTPVGTHPTVDAPVVIVERTARVDRRATDNGVEKNGSDA